jgi:hypothetical protein
MPRHLAKVGVLSMFRAPNWPPPQATPELEPEQPAGEVLIAWPDQKAERNLYEIKIPILGSLMPA